jgi:hypothetical protein
MKSPKVLLVTSIKTRTLTHKEDDDERAEFGTDRAAQASQS